nr:MAG TPA: hypothetical protein [Caudoviricetes sp.]
MRHLFGGYRYYCYLCNREKKQYYLLIGCTR